jgi:hypothetical protein
MLVAWLFMLELRLKRIFLGEKPKGLEDVLSQLGRELESLNKAKEKAEKQFEDIEKRLRQTVKNIGIVRFNPFNDAGSNQSFAIALLDERGSGAVISSLYSREGVKVYAKPITNYKSEYSLTNEEQEAINKTRN